MITSFKDSRRREWRLNTDAASRGMGGLMMRRLEHLANADSANSSRIGEEKELIAALTGKYGDLGIKLDETTGKLTGLAEAKAKANAAMREADIAEVDANIAQRHRNIAALDKEISDIAPPGATHVRWDLRHQLHTARADRAAQSSHLEALQARRRLLRDGGSGGIVG